MILVVEYPKVYWMFLDILIDGSVRPNRSSFVWIWLDNKNLSRKRICHWISQCLRRTRNTWTQEGIYFHRAAFQVSPETTSSQQFDLTNFDGKLEVLEFESAFASYVSNWITLISYLWLVSEIIDLWVVMDKNIQAGDQKPIVIWHASEAVDEFFTIVGSDIFSFCRVEHPALTHWPEWVHIIFYDLAILQVANFPQM